MNRIIQKLKHQVKNRKVLRVMLKVLDYMVMACIVSMMVILSIRLSEMKLVYYAGENWLSYDFWFKEYSLTVGFVSFLLPTLGLSIYSFIKNRLAELESKVKE
jgi:hypothetical protein